MGLRQAVYEAAQETFAYDADIKYAKVKGSLCHKSDLNVVLYFKKEGHALTMRNKALTAHKRWSGLIVTDRVVESNHVVQNPVRATDYIATLSPAREKWDASEVHRAVDDEPSKGTTVLDAEVIANESIVHPAKAFLKFRRAHIDASLKNTPKDDESNTLPLPLDWHGLFDGETVDDVPFISILLHASTKKHDRQNRVEIKLHVLFKTPQLAFEYAPKLRDARVVRPQVYEVMILKADPAKLKKHLEKRHSTVVMQWGGSP